MQQRGGQQRDVLREPELPGAAERRGRVFAARQKDIERHQPGPFGFRQFQSGECCKGERTRRRPDRSVVT